MYFGTLLIGIGVILTILKFWTAPLFLVIYFLIYVPQVKREQKILSERFGQDYLTYIQSTPMFLPGFNLKDFCHLPFKLQWIKKELPSLVLTLAFVVMIEVWQDSRLFGITEIWEETLELTFVVLVFILIMAALGRREET